MKFKSRQAVHEYLKNSKIYVNGKSEQVQNALFEYGFTRHSLEKKVEYCESPFIYIYDDTFASGTNMILFSSYEEKEIKADDILSIEIEPEKVIRDGKVAVCYCPRGEGLSRYNHIYPELLFSPKIVKMIEDERQEEITSEWIEKELGIKVVDIGFCDFLTIKWIPEGEQFQITAFDGCEDIWLLKELNNVFTA